MTWQMLSTFPSSLSKNQYKEIPIRVSQPKAAIGDVQVKEHIISVHPVVPIAELSAWIPITTLISTRQRMQALVQSRV
jgi:hypothetical protein